MNLLILSQLFFIVTVTYSLPSQINLCKHKPYLVSCQNQQLQAFFAEKTQLNELPLPRPNLSFKHFASDNPTVHHNEPTPLITNAERNQVLHENPGLLVTPPVVNDNGPGARFTTPVDLTAKTTTNPIDMSRPNAEDVAREIEDYPQVLPMKAKKNRQLLNGHENNAFTDYYDHEDTSSSRKPETTIKSKLDSSKKASTNISPLIRVPHTRDTKILIPAIFQAITAKLVNRLVTTFQTTAIGIPFIWAETTNTVASKALRSPLELDSELISSLPTGMASVRAPVWR